MFRERMMRHLIHDPFIQSVARRDKPIKNIEYFGYPFFSPSAGIAPGASTEVTIYTEGKSDFVLIEMAGYFAITTAPGDQSLQYADVATFNIYDGQTNTPIFKESANWGTFMAPAGVLFVLPAPRVFRPNSKVRVTFDMVARNAGAGSFLFYGVFHGMQVQYG